MPAKGPLACWLINLPIMLARLHYPAHLLLRIAGQKGWKPRWLLSACSLTQHASAVGRPSTPSTPVWVGVGASARE